MQASVVCSACRNKVAITDYECGEVVCGHCGIVIVDRTEAQGQEWHTVDEFYSKGRTGSPLSLARYNGGFATTVIGSPAKSKMMYADSMSRIRAWDFRIQSAEDRSVRQALQDLERLREKLGLPEAIVEKSAYFYRKASKMGLVKGRTVSSVMAASAYLACRELEAPRTLNEIAASSDVPRKRLARDYRLLVRTFDPKIPTVDIMKCITKIANKTGVSEKTKRQAMKIMRDIAGMEMAAGKGPMGMAATVLYISCSIVGELRTQKDLAAIAGVTEVTIRNRYSELKRHLGSKGYFKASLSAIIIIAFHVSIMSALPRYAATVMVH